MSKEDLFNLKGIGRKTAELLYEAGFETPDDLQRAHVDELTTITGIGAKKAAAIKREAEKRYRKVLDVPTKHDDVCETPDDNHEYGDDPENGRQHRL